MFIPPDIQIKSTLRPGVVYYFVEEKFKATYSHYFVLINSRPITDNKALLLCAVTLDLKVLSRKAALGRIANETLFDITPEQCSIFRHPTLFDCNDVLEKPISYLIDKLSQGRLQIKGDIPKDILYRLQEGVLASKMIDRRHKKLIIITKEV